MADFVEWYEGTGGGGGGEGFGDDEDLLRELQEGAPASFQAERDAVLFLIDVSESMFVGSVVSSGPHEKADANPFASAVHCALAFYQEKVITSDKDLVALVLYNSKRRLNLYSFPGVYVFHEFDVPGASRVQELQVLGKAGSGDPRVKAEFQEHIGHGAPKASCLSEALWAAQHMFRHLASKSIHFRRIFLFTNNDDPCASVPLERERCMARMKDLHEAGVALEVFAHGREAIRSGSIPSAPVASATGGKPSGLSTLSTTGNSGPSAPGAGPSATLGSSIRTSPPLPPPSSIAGVTPSLIPPSAPEAVGSVPQVRDSATSAAAVRGLLGTTTTGVTAPLSSMKAEDAKGDGFDRSKFWSALVAAPLRLGHNSSSLINSVPQSDTYDDDGEYCGTVHVSPSHASFDAMINVVKLRTHPQRATGTLELRIGYGGKDFSAPQMHVQVYVPVVRCPKPRFRWLDGTTNVAVTTETRLLSKATGGPVAPADLRYTTQVAGQEVTFTQDEVVTMKRVCSGPQGIVILGFKRVDEALRVKYSVSRSAFLHCSARKGGGLQALKLFVQLHRSLSTQQKVAVAELVAREGGAPRVVALLPSRLPYAGSGAASSVDLVSGMGFHMIHLPYADDIRSFHPPPLPPTARPTEAQVQKAKRIVQRLQADYDVMAIANPAIQRQYHILQQLALIDPVDDTGVEDLTLPDTEGMKQFASLFVDFNASVFPEGYQAELICPQPKPAKKPPSAAELAAIDFDDLEKKSQLDVLTMPFLQQYLKALNEDSSGCKLKHELVARVAEVVRKRRGIKREREDD